MNLIKTSFAITVIILFTSAIPLMAEFIFLKDGSIIKGTVINETAQGITFRNEQNNVAVYPHNNIMRVLYNELNMGKIYVQLKSGENFRGYMVDEDQSSYTFRYEINKPIEFNVIKSLVLFIAERNPSGLKGKSGYTDISLNWFLPYDKMKYFNIYFKKKREDKYNLAGTAGSNSYKLKDLNCNTKYFVRITGVDETGIETLPSNEIEITTFVKVDVQLKSGKKFRSNLVAEDWEKYTFRDDLDKIMDFTVNRVDVQFITERFPSGLTGKADTDTIKLNWFEPYDSILEYRIYVKKYGEEYKSFVSSRDNSYTLKGLKGNTKYLIKITGLSKNKSETPPSNEILVTTLNQPPSMPAGLKVTQTKTGEIVIEWKAAKDPDGTVIKYRVYKVIKNKTDTAGEVNATTFKINEKIKIERILVSAVDNNGAESDTAGVWLNQKDKFSIAFIPGIMLPIDTFGSMFDVGYGGNLSFMWQNLFIQGYALGFELGYYYFPGRTNTIRLVGQEIHWMHLTTAAVKTGYVYKFNSFLFITGTVSIGAGYMYTYYTASDYQTLVQTQKVSMWVDPMASLGVSLDFMITNNFFLGINAGYGLFFETQAVYQFFTFGVNIGARF